MFDLDHFYVASKYKGKTYYTCKQHRKKLTKDWEAKNKEYVSEWRKHWNKKKRDTDPSYKIKQNLRRRIHKALKEVRKHSTTQKLLGCSIEIYKQHLESQFRDGMSWDNYGTLWHVDHIKPLCSFDLKVVDQQYAAFNYKNTQPLLVFENLSKGGKY